MAKKKKKKEEKRHPGAYVQLGMDMPEPEDEESSPDPRLQPPLFSDKQDDS